MFHSKSDRIEASGTDEQHVLEHPTPLWRRLLRIVALGLAGLVVLGAIGVLGLRYYVHSAEPDRRDFALTNLKEQVQVEWDAHGIPSIQAANEVDLYRALGFVHGQDRLWQMDFLRRVSQGRLSEILGPDQVEADRFLRTIGMRQAAEKDVAMLGSEERELLEAYADGVNEWMAQHPGALPPEFLALRYEPEKWTVVDSLSVAKVIAWNLSAWDIELQLQRALDIVGKELERTIEPAYPAWGPRTLKTSGTWKERGAGVDREGEKHGRLEPSPDLRMAIPEPPRALLARATIANASNAWVVNGSKTRSGSPILANDTHQGIQAPAIWYLTALRGGKTEVCGLTVPGLPFVIIGRTRAVAWGITASLVDDVDFFEEQLTPDGGYVTAEGIVPLESRVEVIEVRGAAAVHHVVRSTRHGPLLSDVHSRGGNRALAMSWTALEPARSSAGLRAMNQARTVDEFLHGLSLLATPTINVLFAANDGTIGYHLGGRVPVRRGGDGLLPAPGWSGDFDWIRYLDFDELPSARNPPEGFLASANNLIIGEEYPHLLTRAWSEPYRIQRIEELLRDRRDITASEVARNQLDQVDRHAMRVLPRAIRAAELAGDADAVAALRGWNGEARSDSHAAALFYVWFEVLRRRLAEDEYGEGPVFFPTMAVDAVLEEGSGKWVDDTQTPEVETLDQLMAAAMREAISKVNKRNWGSLLSTMAAHPLGSSSVLDALLRVNVGPYPGGGSEQTLNVASYGTTDRFPTISSFGPSMRFIADMANPDAPGSGFLLPTGQSGLPFSDHYRDLRALWVRGEVIPIPLDGNGTSTRALVRQRLSPKR